jgi:hypothetical protein
LFDPRARHLSKEKPAQKQEAQHKDKCQNYDFDKAHKSSILKRPKRDSIPAMQSMSKHFKAIIPMFAAAVLILQTLNKCAAQDIEATVRVDPQRSIAHVKGRSLKERHASSPLTFLSSYAGIGFRADRITNVRQRDDSWSYDVDLSPMKEPAASARVSWLTKSDAILMLQDLLPHSPASQSAKVTFELPEERENFSTMPLWPVSTTERRLDDGSYLVRSTDKAVFYLRFDSAYPLDSPNRRAPMISVFTASSVGGVALTDVAEEIYIKYRSIFAHDRRPIAIALSRFPLETSGARWEADTRGTSITIVSSEPTFKSQSTQQLHEQLRHEMFHVWIPEGVNLTGHYDWFYEGFAVYQSLKLGVAVNRLRFEDYLDTLSRAYDIDRRLGGKISLIEAANNRWSGDNNTVVYARGMLVAFLCDLALMNASKGKVSTDDIVREVFSKHSGTAQPTDGNAAVLSILKARSEVVPIVDAYVAGTRGIDWTALISSAGLQAETRSGATVLTVVAKPTGAQKRLLDKLGYNNWRKLTTK